MNLNFNNFFKFLSIVISLLCFSLSYGLSQVDKQAKTVLGSGYLTLKLPKNTIVGPAGNASEPLASICGEYGCQSAAGVWAGSNGRNYGYCKFPCTKLGKDKGDFITYKYTGNPANKYPGLP